MSIPLTPNKFVCTALSLSLEPKLSGDEFSASMEYSLRLVLVDLLPTLVVPSTPGPPSTMRERLYKA